VDTAGRPMVAYQDAPGSPGARLVVKGWDGGVWSELGRLGSASAAAPTLALDGNGAPAVAWVEGTAAPHALKAARFVSGTWSQFPDAITMSGTEQGDPGEPKMALGADGSPWLAFRGLGNFGSNVGDCIQSWDPTARVWTLSGCYAHGYGGGVSVQIDSSGRPLFAYTYADESGISVLEFDGAKWANHGGAPCWGVEPSLAVNAHGGVIAWKNRSVENGVTVFKVYAKTWDGSDWAPRGPPSTLPPALSTVDGFLPSAAVDAVLGPVVGWALPRGGVYVKRLNGADWVYVGSNLSAGVPANSLQYGPAVATDRLGGNLFVAWNQDATLRVVRHNR
jgi:hypothetical protein